MSFAPIMPKQSIQREILLDQFYSDLTKCKTYEEGLDVFHDFPDDDDSLFAEATSIFNDFICNDCDGDGFIGKTITHSKSINPPEDIKCHNCGGTGWILP